MVSDAPVISENVTSILMSLYPQLTKEELLSRLSRAPQTTTIRVNTCLVTLDEAIVELHAHLLPGSRYNVIKHPSLPDVVLILANPKLKAAAMRYEKEVVVDVMCGAAVLRGADVFAPGVLAANPGMKKGDYVSVFADLERKCPRGFIKLFEKPKFYVGSGEALLDRGTIFESTKPGGVAVRMISALPSFTNLNNELFFPQNLPSIIVSHVLDPKEGDLVLDMCAAPGGKTTHIATLMKNKGKLISIDKTAGKVKRIKENCEKLGLTNVHCFCYDSSSLLNKDADADELVLKPPFKRNSFDKILLDPPCSGLGQRPQLRYISKDKEILSYPLYQQKFFKQAFHLLKPGGHLVYSTCTLLPQENEKQIAWVLSNFPELQLVEQSPTIGNPGIANFGVEDKDLNKLQRFDKFLTIDSFGANMIDMDDSEAPNGVDTVASNYDVDTIGFFIAKFVKS